MKRTSLLALALVLGAGTSARAQVQVTEHFDDDPAARGWAGVNNRINGQDYGFSTGDVTGADVNPPGGTASAGGEIGGVMLRQEGTWNGGQDNFYGVDINGELDISTQGFTVKGVIHVQQPDGASGVLFGYSRGVASYADPGERGDARNFIGIDFDDTITSYPIMFSSGGGRDANFDPNVPDLVSGATVSFSMIYDPNANGGTGSLAFEINGVPWTWNLPGGAKNNVNPLTHFGIMPVSADGADAIIWFDDLEYTAYAAFPPATSTTTGLSTSSTSTSCRGIGTRSARRESLATRTTTARSTFSIST